jgi:hypothetical protein
MQTLLQRRHQREEEEVETLDRPQDFAAGVRDYIKKHHLQFAEVKAVFGPMVQIKDSDRAFTLIALPRGKWRIAGKECNHTDALDTVLDFLGYPSKEAVAA